MERDGCIDSHELLDDGVYIMCRWNVDFALVDEREKKKIQKESNELDALISK